MTLQASHNGAISNHPPLNEAWPTLSSQMENISIKPALDNIRNMPEFKPPEKDYLEELLKQPWAKEGIHKLNHLFDGFINAIAKLLSHAHLPGANHLPENIRDLFSGVISFIIVLFGLFIAYVILGWVLRLTNKQASTAHTQDSRLFEDTLLVDSAFHTKRAQEFAAQHNFAEGIRQRYLALLCLLDESKLIPFISTRSNEEYQHLLKSQLTSAEAPFYQLAQEFETVRYGNLSAQPQQYQACERWYQQLQQSIQPHA